MDKKFTSTIAGASLLIVIFNLLGRGIGLIREVLFANFFGLSNQFELYLIAAVIPLTINSIAIYFGQNYLIPAYFKIKDADSEILDNFLVYNFIFFFLIGVIISLVLFYFADNIIILYINNVAQKDVEVATSIFKVFLFSIPLHFLISFISAVKQINFNFSFPVYSQFLFNITFLVLLVIFNNKYGIYILPFCYIAGSAFQFVFLLKGTRFNFKKINILNTSNTIRRCISSSFFIIILIESIGQLYVFADRIFYSYLPAGGLAALNYSYTIFMLPVSIVSIALSTAIFPRFSRNFRMERVVEFETDFIKSIKVNIIVFIPITIIFLFYGDVIINILYERGEFSGIDTLVTYKTLVYYSISLIFYSIYSVINKIFYVADLTINLLYITIIGIIIKIILNFFLAKNMGQEGLALSTSISYLFFFFSTLYILLNRLPFKNSNILFYEILFHTVNGFFAIVIVQVLSSILTTDFLNYLIQVILFCSIFVVNIFLVEHSSVGMFNKMINNLRRKINGNKI